MACCSSPTLLRPGAADRVHREIAAGRILHPQGASRVLGEMIAGVQSGTRPGEVDLQLTGELYVQQGEPEPDKN